MRLPTCLRSGFRFLPYSDHEVDYQAIRAIHAASSLDRPLDVAMWRAAAPAALGEPSLGQGEALPRLSSDGVSPDPIETVILKRGSSRRFRPDPMSVDQLGTLLHAATRGIPGDFLAGSGLELNQAYLIANAVQGLPSGSYAVGPSGSDVQRLSTGDFRKRAEYLALTQQLAADAAVNVYFLADLAPVLERLGNRGYRAAQLEASITAGKLYLGAYALGLGASGLTFFDDDVTAFFSPHAAGKSVMFLITVGHPHRRTS